MAYNCSKSVESTKHTASERADMNELPETAQECLINKSLCMLMSMGQKNRPKTRSRLENALGPCTVVVPYANPLDVLAAANKLSTQPTPSVSIPHAKKRVYTTLDKVDTNALIQLIQSINEKNSFVSQKNSEKSIVVLDDAIAWLQSDPEGTEESLIEELLHRCKKEDQDNPGLVLEHLQETGKVKVDECGRVLYFLPSKDIIYADRQRRLQISFEKFVESLTLGEHNSLSSMSTSVVEHLCIGNLRPSTVPELLEVIKTVCPTFVKVTPSQLFAAMKIHIKHRQVEDKTEDQDSKKNQPKKSRTNWNETQSESKPNSTTIQNESERTELKPRKKTEFAIGMFPGENNKQEYIMITPEGLTGIEVLVTDAITTSDKQLAGASVKWSDRRLRAVGQCKGFIEVFRNRLTVAARGRNAIIVPASEQEEKDMISKVAEWVNSDHRYSSDTHGVAGAASADTTHHTVTQLQLQQELINICVGKVRHLTPSTIIDVLQKDGFITIDDEQSVTYQLTTDRDKKPSWQEDTIKAAAESCRCSGMLRKAFPAQKKDYHPKPQLINDL